MSSLFYIVQLFIEVIACKALKKVFVGGELRADNLEEANELELVTLLARYQLVANHKPRQYHWWKGF
jgi:hypothetical protein